LQLAKRGSFARKYSEWRRKAIKEYSHV